MSWASRGYRSKGTKKRDAPWAGHIPPLRRQCCRGGIDAALCSLAFYQIPVLEFFGVPISRGFHHLQGRVSQRFNRSRK